MRHDPSENPEDNEEHEEVGGTEKGEITGHACGDQKEGGDNVDDLGVDEPGRPVDPSLQAHHAHAKAQLVLLLVR